MSPTDNQQALLEQIERLAKDPQTDPRLRPLYAVMLHVWAEHVRISARREDRISELEHRVRFLASCLLAGDVLVPSGRLMMESSRNMLEEWIVESVRARQ